MFSSERDFSEWRLSGFEGIPAKLYPSTESTHSLMKEQALANEIQPGALIVADFQNGGRGRHERTWISPAKKNLYFNILLPLEGIPTKNYAQITQVTALTFADVFRSLQKDIAVPCTETNSTTEKSQITVKWPNDILFDKSKFCGILAEVILIPKTSGFTPALNLGVGINVNGDISDYACLHRDITTLKAIVGKTINREKLLQVLTASLERAILQFRAFGISPWVNAWRKMDRFIGARGTIVVSDLCTDSNRDGGQGVEKKTGRIIDMQADGSLLFETDDGIRHVVYSADLEI